MSWDFSKWGEPSDPIHKSDLNGIVGKFGCTEQFFRKKEAKATGAVRVYDKAGGKLISGNAVHAVICRVLRSKPALQAALTPGFSFARETLRKSFNQEFDRERAGREVEWYKVNSDKWIDDQVSILEGVFAELSKHVHSVVLAEAGFILELDGIWLTGMTDLLYNPVKAPETIALADWKSGANKPHPIELDHSWEGGIYSAAVHSGWFVPGEAVAKEDGKEHRDSVEAVCVEMAEALNKGDEEKKSALISAYGFRQFGQFPSEIRHVHMRDLIPYSRKSSKLLTRPEELAWAGLQKPGKVEFQKGDFRGPAWLHVRRTEGDIPRLRSMLRNVVQWVRSGLFVAAPGELCTRCQFREPCLNSGYGVTGAEADALQASLDALGGDFDGFDYEDGP